MTLVLVAIGSWRNWESAALFELDRGYHLIFATAVIACLLLIRYYSIPVPRAYKLLLGGFCLYSCTEILINSVVQALFYRRFGNYEPLWQFVTMFSFVVAQGMWIAALWRRLPAEGGPQNKNASAGVSPQRLREIHENLRELNDKLGRLWNLEAH